MKTRVFWNTILALVICAVALASHAQSIPGRWHKVALPQPNGGNDNTTDFSFVDSLHGICLSDAGSISSSSNSGKSWELDTNLNSAYIYKMSLPSVECIAPLHGFFWGTSESLIMLPAGTALLSTPRNNEVNLGDYTTLAEKMYDTSYGFRLVYLSTVRDTSPNNVHVIVTHDGWHSSDDYRSSYLTGRGLTIGYMVDSNDVWAADGGSFGKTTMKIYHSTNGAETWDTSVISGNNQTQIESFCVNSKTREVYFLNNLLPYDYAYSSDYGTTWHLDSTFGLRLWRLANPVPGVLWAMLGESGPGWNGSEIDVIPGGMANKGSPADYSRRVGYSSDNGKTWLIDSTTFLHDSLQEMHFFDARHGWIASWSHDSSFMWYYDPDGTSGVIEDKSVIASQEPALYPNPVTETLTVRTDGQRGEVKIFDMLSREVLRATIPASGEARVDVRQLAPGGYFLVAGSVSSRFIKE